MTPGVRDGEEGGEVAPGVALGLARLGDVVVTGGGGEGKRRGAGGG